MRWGEEGGTASECFVICSVNHPEPKSAHLVTEWESHAHEQDIISTEGNTITTALVSPYALDKRVINDRVSVTAVREKQGKTKVQFVICGGPFRFSWRCKSQFPSEIIPTIDFT